jgi:hypothetical protein
VFLSLEEFIFSAMYDNHFYRFLGETDLDRDPWRSKDDPDLVKSSYALSRDADDRPAVEAVEGPNLPLR